MVVASGLGWRMMTERAPLKPAAMFDLSGRVAIVTGASPVNSPRSR
ncbi:MAG TPA: hypothetical protein VHZ03_13980 [Trebonia sp.]|jgi:hypothetical protein|nr:hypothetical protein [Trebonia sp.]